LVVIVATLFDFVTKKQAFTMTFLVAQQSVTIRKVSNMKKDFNKYVKSLDEKGLAKELKMLYDKFELVRKYYKAELSEDANSILAEYKLKLKKEYFPTRGYGKASSGTSRKVVIEFKKIATHSSDVVELWLYRTEMMLEYTLTYGDIDEHFYNSLYTGFAEACKLISKEALHKHYQDDCLKLINMSEELGWGVPDDLHSAYMEYFDAKKT
jgi:hypothetical protein